jgi:ABC-type cobalamin/Fe3+-siderophores transport system ATPase subunit
MTKGIPLDALAGPIKIEVSGPCAAGKSTLISAINNLLKGTKLADNILIIERQVAIELELPKPK